MQHFVVTGAGRGIGLELVRAILAGGDRVTATARDPAAPGLAALAAEHGDRLTILHLDVTDEAAVAGLGARVDGPVDGLVNNAGVLLERNPDTLAPDLSWAVFERSFLVNAIAPLFVTRALAGALGPGSRVMMVSSFMGSMSYDKSDTTAYRASKAALNRITLGLAKDLKPRGVTVFAVHPGWVRTDMGGPSADVSPADSAAGLLALCRRVGPELAGRFMSHDGRDLSW